MAQDSPNAKVPAGTVLARWTALTVILALFVVYFMMRMIGFVQTDAVWIAGLSTAPLAVAVIVGVIVWKFYWKME
jgi:hypothetical protein